MGARSLVLVSAESDAGVLAAAAAEGEDGSGTVESWRGREDVWLRTARGGVHGGSSCSDASLLQRTDGRRQAISENTMLSLLRCCCLPDLDCERIE